MLGQTMMLLAFGIIIYVCFKISLLVGLTSVAIVLMLLGSLFSAIAIKEKMEVQERG